MYIEEFHKWLLDQGRAAKTINAYLRSVTDLAKWYQDREGEEFDPAVIRADVLHDYRAYLETVERKLPTTVNQRIAALKTYWSFLVEEKGAPNDPTRKVKLKHITQMDLAPKWLDRKEQSRLLNALELKPEKETHSRHQRRIRDIAMVQLMLQCGLRVSEVSALDVDDIDLKKKVVIIRQGKGGKFRIVPMNKDVIQSVQHWIGVREEHKEKAGDIRDPVFLSERRTRITDRGIQHALEKYFRIAGIEGTPHNLRHTCAKNLLDSKNELNYVQRILGHESIQTTQRYMIPSEADLRRAVESIGEYRGVSRNPERY